MQVEASGSKSKGETRMVSSAGPIVAIHTFAVSAGSSSSRLLLDPDLYTHAIVIATRDCWLATGGAGVVAAVGEDLTLYLPRDNYLQLMSKRQAGDGVTHIAARTAGGQGFLNISYIDAIQTEADTLTGILDCPRQWLETWTGKPSYEHRPLPFKSHVDYTE